MIHRLIYYSQLRQAMASEFQRSVQEDAAELRDTWANLKLANVSVFSCESYVCVYAEVEGADGADAPGWDWPMAYDRYLEKWPTEPAYGVLTGERPYRLAIPMIDVFHDGSPERAHSWRDGSPVEQRIGSLARLKPQKVSSYIYYHYQKQEESPGSFNETYIIGIAGRLIFSYYELPSRVSPIQPQGLLNTKNSPDNWHEVMLPHFEPWEDEPEGQRLWRKMERLL